MMHTLQDEAKMIEVEAIRRAAINTDSFIDDKLQPAKVRKVRLMLARRYDKLVKDYRLDTHELLEERIQSEM
jgi:hypothetical protein